MTTKKLNTHIALFWASLAFLSVCLQFVDFAPVRVSHYIPNSVKNKTAGLEAPDGLSHLRAAERLHERLLHASSPAPSVASLAKALSERETLLKRATAMELVTNGPAAGPWRIDLSAHPEWLTMKTSRFSASYTIDPAKIAQYLSAGADGRLSIASHADITDIRDDKGVQRASITGIAKHGYTLDFDAAATHIAEALARAEEHVYVSAQYGGGTITYHADDGSTEHLELIATGRSNFAHSPEARQSNVLKAFNERVHGVWIPAWGTFSFNAILGGPVTLEKGWKEALGLFGGGAAMTPGGGICQAATTVYRAALLAGLPILKHRSHSLYVSYYEAHGVGMDATIFPGVQDLVFKNDTPGAILLQAYTQGDEAYVQVFGQSDGRRVALEGPFLSTTTPLSATLRPLARNEIAWVQHVTYPDGSTQSRPFLSRYAKGIPTKLRKEYPQATVIANEAVTTLAKR